MIDAPTAKELRRLRETARMRRRRADPIMRARENARSARSQKEKYWSDDDRRKRLIARAARGVRKIRSGYDAETYDRMVAEQDGKCFLCGQPPKRKALNADHDPQTGAIRRPLCMRCNTGLGAADDDPNVLRFAAETREPKRLFSWFKGSSELLLKAANYIERFRDGIGAKVA